MCIVVMVMRNVSGLHEFDPDGKKADVLERAIGIKVIKHSKPNSLKYLSKNLIWNCFYILSELKCMLP